eukprot:gene2932-1914_t
MYPNITIISNLTQPTKLNKHTITNPYKINAQSSIAKSDYSKTMTNHGLRAASQRVTHKHRNRHTTYTALTPPLVLYNPKHKAYNLHTNSTKSNTHNETLSKPSKPESNSKPSYHNIRATSQVMRVSRVTHYQRKQTNILKSANKWQNQSHSQLSNHTVSKQASSMPQTKKFSNTNKHNNQHNHQFTNPRNLLIPSEVIARLMSPSKQSWYPQVTLYNLAVNKLSEEQSKLVFTNTIQNMSNTKSSNLSPIQPQHRNTLTIRIDPQRFPNIERFQLLNNTYHITLKISPVIQIKCSNKITQPIATRQQLSKNVTPQLSLPYYKLPKSSTTNEPTSKSPKLQYLQTIRHL